MSTANLRKVAILEPVSIFVLIMAYIWGLRYSHPSMWLGILGLMLVSHAVHREQARTLGFRLARLRECWQELAPVLVFLVLLLLAGSILLGTIRPIGFDRAMISWAAYLPWGLFQQYILNGYFLNRFEAVTSSGRAPMIAAAFFSGAHLPNWFLMAVTLLLGYCCALIYRRYKNLYFLGLAHATIGFLLLLVVPDSISHHLTVGPGWFGH